MDFATDDPLGETVEEEIDVDDEDIYGDLEASVFTNANTHGFQSNEANSKITLLQTRYDELSKEHERLKVKVRRLLQENRTYATNISSLYMTAKDEDDRKTDIIRSLRTKLVELQKAGKPFKDTNDKNPPDIQRSSSNKPDSLLSAAAEYLPQNMPNDIVLEVQKSIERLKNSSLTKIKKDKKTFKFGKNMSIFFCRQQTPFPSRKKGEVSLVCKSKKKTIPS